MKNLYTVQLHRADLMELENHLAQALRGLLPFSSYSLYFPTQQACPQEPQWISRERSLLLPLWHDGVPLGVFMARGVDGRTVRRLLPSLEALSTLCMQHLLCIKQSRIDELTGLARMPRLLEQMQQNADMVRNYSNAYGNDDMATEQQVPLHKACMGLIVLRCPALDSLATEFGYTFAHEALSAWAKALQENLPQEVLAARSGENECTLLLPTASRTSCSTFTEEVMARVDAVTLTHTASKRTIRLHSVAGFALYPQDMETTRLALGMAEQSHYVLQKARHAAHMAFERSRYLPKNERNLAHNRYLAYARVLAQGGIIQDVLPHGQVLTNIGRQAGAKEGQHFAIWGQKKGTWQRKGEIVLMEVRNAQSVAEALHLYDPAWPWEEGDNIRIIDAQQPQASAHVEEKQQHASPDAPSALGTSDALGTPDILDTSNALSTSGVAVPSSKATTSEKGAAHQDTGATLDVLLSHRDFLQHFTKKAEQHTSFSLALIRICHAPAQQENVAVEHVMRLYEHNAYDENTNQQQPVIPFDGKALSNPTLKGRYGETSLIFFHPATTAKALKEQYTLLAQKAQQEGIELAIGIANYPYLQAHKRDILEYCHKALELALLLPEPHVGCMGSLALNISADQRYSRGDVFGAIEEYKLAILADAANAMAWNSLGVCMAALNRPSEARQHFKEALKLWQKKPYTSTVLEQTVLNIPQELAATLYNLGTVCQSLGETRAATKYFKQCIEVDASHYFAHIRLGQITEKSGKWQQARQYYTLAKDLENKEDAKESGSNTSLAYRCLARVALQQKKDAEARELLHESLLHNPQDAVALCMLAEIYLQSGEDPSMSEMLARKSVGLRPEYANAWRILAQSLRALGQEDAALNAEDKAATL